MGPYCQFCDHRCFVERLVPNPLSGESATLLLATCRKGMEHDRRATGYDHTTAANPRGGSQ